MAKSNNKKNNKIKNGSTQKSIREEICQHIIKRDYE